MQRQGDDKVSPMGVALDPRVRKILDALALEEDRSVSSMIRVLINEALDARMRNGWNPVPRSGDSE